METIKLFEMFSGFGGASFGLKKANIPFECVGISEIDKYAVQCFNNNFPNIKNFGDCTKINPEELPDFDLLTGGFPCQDVSIAGNRDLSKGRTNLYQEILRIVNVKKPKFILLENVKGLLSMEVEERSLVLKIVSDLQKLGYGVCWKVLNSKDYGIPQNRERVWFVCKLGGWDFMEFQFPHPTELKIFLKDILEKEIDEKYYLSEKSIKRLLNNGESYHSKINPEISSTIFAQQYKIARGMDLISVKTRDISTAINIAQEIADKEQKPVQVDLYHLQNGEIRPLSTYIPQNLDVHRCLQSGEPKEVLIEPKIKECLNCNVKLEKYQDYDGNWWIGCPKCDESDELIKFEPKIIGGLQKHQTPRTDGISPSLTSAMGKGGGQTPMILDCYNHKIKEDGVCITLTEPHHNNLRLIENKTIRRLTPTECFRLMGFLDDGINLDGLSDTRKYCLAGNGWDINVVSKIFKEMFK